MQSRNKKTQKYEIIILAAGQGFQLDGFNKLLIKDPVTKKRIIDIYLEIFKDYKITIVLGFRAINVMHEYPKINYIFNPSWATTNNSYSLGLALENKPVIILSGDLIFEKKLITDFLKLNSDAIITKKNFNRSSNSLNSITDKKNLISKIYLGKIKDINHQETMGIFQIKSKEVLKKLATNCLNNKKKFVAEILPIQSCKFKNFDATDYRLDEINNPSDFIKIKNKYSI
jgi:choline kinase